MIDKEMIAVFHYDDGSHRCGAEPYRYAEDVVRCKECKHNWNTCINHGKMNPRCDFTDYKLTEHDFCSRGERRE